MVDLLFTTGHTAPSGDQLVLTELVDRATLLARRPPGQFALRAAIAAVDAEAPSWECTDWTEIVGLYDLLMQCRPSPVVALNRAAAVGLRTGPTRVGRSRRVGG